jgi:hypothetical protein
LERAGFNQFDHLELHRLGIRKGSAPVTDETVASGVVAARQMLDREVAPAETCHQVRTVYTLVPA